MFQTTRTPAQGIFLSVLVSSFLHNFIINQIIFILFSGSERVKIKLRGSDAGSNVMQNGT